MDANFVTQARRRALAEQPPAEPTNGAGILGIRARRVQLLTGGAYMTQRAHERPASGSIALPLGYSSALSLVGRHIAAAAMCRRCYATITKY